MRKYGVFKVKDNVYKPYETPLDADALAGASIDRDDGVVLKDGAPIGVLVDGVPLAGFTTPSRRLEFYSQTLVDWGWPEHAVPRYVPGPRALARPEARRAASSICCRTSGCRRSCTRDRR